MALMDEGAVVEELAEVDLEAVTAEVVEDLD